MKKKVYIETLGCQMNKSDSERIVGMLSHFNYEPTEIAKKADLLIINTCSIRQLSEDKAYSRVGMWGKWKKSKPHIKIGFCGCVAQQDRRKILSRAPYIDLIFGTENIYELPNLLKKLDKDERAVSTFGEIFEPPKDAFNISRQEGINAWIPIIEGCNNFCTYCVVPYTRGRERSRSLQSIVTEAKNAIQQGYKEITLLGQNVDSYGKDLKDENVNLAGLIETLNALEGKFRIRFVTSYPTDITDELIETIKHCEKVCEYFHIPMQSGNNEILRAMNRRYTVAEYVKIAEKVRTTFEDVTITSDFIAGFPGETESQFQDTLDIIDRLEFDYSNTAAYSPRKITVAGKWEDKFLDEETKRERLVRLNDKNKEACLNSNKKCIGKIFEVLVETKEEKNNKTILTGRTRNNKIVHFECNEDLVGKFIDVKITKVKTWYLSGEVC